VAVSVLAEAAITPAVLARFSAVVVTSAPRAAALEWNAACREHVPAIPFIMADVFGAAGFAFSDFGPAHAIKDKDGEPLRSAVVVGVTPVAPTAAAPGRFIVHVHDSKRHGFDEGDAVVFREVKGMAALNDGKPRFVGKTMAHSFDLLLDAEDAAAAAGWADFTDSCVVEQVKVPSVVAFASLRERAFAPVPTDDPMGALITADLGKFGRPAQLHVAFAAVEAFRTAHGQLPPVRDAAAVAECVALARGFVEAAAASSFAGKLALAPADVEADVVARVAALARTELPALCAFFGGVVAQEVVKVTGKYSPLRQWLYLDAFEVFTAATDPAAAAAAAAPAGEFAPAGSRYDGVTSILGRAAQSRAAGAAARHPPPRRRRRRRRGGRGGGARARGSRRARARRRDAAQPRAARHPAHARRGAQRRRRAHDCRRGRGAARAAASAAPRAGRGDGELMRWGLLRQC